LQLLLSVLLLLFLCFFSDGEKKKQLKEVGGEFFASKIKTLSKPNFYSLCTTMELTLYDCSITISNSSHNSADACSHLFLTSIRHKLESKLETLSINHDWATGKMRTQNTNFDCKSPLHK
jgi:hypothetical protein